MRPAEWRCYRRAGRCIWRAGHVHAYRNTHFRSCCWQEPSNPLCASECRRAHNHHCPSTTTSSRSRLSTGCAAALAAQAHMRLSTRIAPRGRAPTLAARTCCSPAMHMHMHMHTHTQSTRTNITNAHTHARSYMHVVACTWTCPCSCRCPCPCARVSASRRRQRRLSRRQRCTAVLHACVPVIHQLARLQQNVVELAPRITTAGSDADAERQ